MTNIEENKQFDVLKERMRIFLLEREWNHFHTPKNIAMSISIESAELMEIFQWTNPTATDITNNHILLDQVKDELADIQIYLVSLALALNIDLFSCALDKMEKNNHRFPPK